MRRLLPASLALLTGACALAPQETPVSAPTPSVSLPGSVTLIGRSPSVGSMRSSVRFACSRREGVSGSTRTKPLGESPVGSNCTEGSSSSESKPR